MPSSWTAEDLVAIETAIAQGVREVEYNDRKVKYSSIDDMLKVRTLIRRSLGLEKRGARLLCKTSKGTC